MLGERRSNSLFAPAAPAEPERKPEQAEVHDISFEERTGRSLFAETATAPRASELFFAPQEKGITFAEALSQVQGYLSETYATLITEDNSDAKEQMKRRMTRYLQENRIAVDGMTASELVDALYTEMAEYGFLTKYIFADGIEEIDINSWRDIEIQYSDGHTAKLEEHFDSPEHAANVIRRMLQNSGKVLDNASPIITSRLARNIRISVIKTPVLDEDAGVAASIRIVNPRNLSKADFVQSGTATEEMLDFLSACLRYGVSICVAGATSSGKTTVAGWLLSTIPDRKRIFTIEDGSRELQLIREHDGRVTNSVVHTQTRDSENERQRIDQIALLDIALRFNPDIICVGEMRGPEANAAQEAARVGIAVLTTIHSNSSEGTYRRMVSLCKRAVDTPDDTLMGYVTEAQAVLAASGRADRFPMVCFTSLLCFALGACIAIAAGNAFLVPVLAVGLMLTPFWYVKLTAGSFKKDVAAELETALSVITTAYLRTENFQQAVEENVRYLHPPVQEVFQRFLMRIKHIDPDMDAALVDLKAAIDNEVWREWCDAVMACQTDRSLTSILTPIVSKLSDMRVVNAELENLVFGPRKEFITMAILVLINIPLVRFINKDWYHTLVATIPGQMVIAVCLAAVFVSFAFVVKLTQPIEYRR